MISSRTGGAAVAVNASTGGRPSASIAAPSRRYSGRKSWPHSEMRVRLVDHEQRDVGHAQLVQHRLARELLGREEQELERPLGQLVQRVLALAPR